jgi:hypothetical protein
MIFPDGQQRCVVRLWSSNQTTEGALHHFHAPDEVQALHSLQSDSSDTSIRMLVAMENGLIQECTMPAPFASSQQGSTSGFSSPRGEGMGSALPSPALVHSDGVYGVGALPMAISHDVATLRRTPRVAVKALRHVNRADHGHSGIVQDGDDIWSLELMLQTLSKVALVNKSIAVDIIVHSQHPAVAPQVAQIDSANLLPQECAQRLHQMFNETANMAAVTGAQQCLHMCCTMMLQVLLTRITITPTTHLFPITLPSLFRSLMPPSKLSTSQ